MSDPRNREIGFVSSSFSFRACRACVRARRSCVGARRTLSLTLGLRSARIHVCCAPLGDQLLCAGALVLSVFAQKNFARSGSFVRRRLGFQSFQIFEMLLLCAGAWVLRVFCILFVCFWSNPRVLSAYFGFLAGNAEVWGS